mgnify:CR=1 FL=1
MIKWTIFILVLTIGCNQRSNKSNNLADCEGLAEVIKNGWNDIENESELRHLCGQGFSDQFRSIVNTQSCKLQKDVLIDFMGVPDTILIGVKHSFMVNNSKDQKGKYITFWYRCYSETKSIVKGKVEPGIKNLFILVDKESGKVHSVYETGL